MVGLGLSERSVELVQVFAAGRERERERQTDRHGALAFIYLE
jgi:hypothetical protein